MSVLVHPTSICYLANTAELFDTSSIAEVALWGVCTVNVTKVLSQVATGVFERQGEVVVALRGLQWVLVLAALPAIPVFTRGAGWLLLA